MEVGVCGGLEQASALAGAGADFLEVSIRSLTKPEVASWERPPSASNALPVPTANSFVAPDVRLTGPDVDIARQNAILELTLSRAAATDVRLIVFGSGAARNVPDGFAPDTAFTQIVDFARRAARVAAVHGIVIVVEPLNRGECNILTTLGEAARIVDAVDHPNLQLLLDSYHFWLEDDSLAELQRRLPIIRHVHVADKMNRAYPGESGDADYRPMFSLLKSGGYDGKISIEAAAPSSADVIPRSIEYVRRAWRDA